MTEWLVWSGLFTAGAGLGLFFYGGLWWTVRHLPTVRHPALWMLASFIVRLVVAIGGLYLLMAGDWRRLAVALAGFVLMRMFLVRRVKNAHAIQP